LKLRKLVNWDNVPGKDHKELGGCCVLEEEPRKTKQLSSRGDYKAKSPKRVGKGEENV